jgi:hypothetical protein
LTTGSVNADANIPVFGEPYRSMKMQLTTTNATQVMTVPYFWGNATAQFHPTKIVITNNHAADTALVFIWDDDIDADAATVRTPGANGSATVPLIARYVATKSTVVVDDFKEGYAFNLGVAAISDKTVIDITVYGYMRK